MLKSSLIEIIRTFTKQELIKFEDFVRSPYLNKKENVTKLFLGIKNYAPEFTDGNLDKEKIWIKIFSGKEYNYGIMKNLIHELNKLCESFITIEFTKDDKLENSINLLSALQHRQVTKVFSSKIDMIEKIYNNPDLKSERYGIENYYEFLDKLYYLKSQYNWHHNMKSTAAYECTSRCTDYLLYSAIIYFYKYYNNYLAHNNKEVWNKSNAADIFLAGLNNNLISQLLENVKVKSERDYLILKCFYDMNIAIDPDADINSYFNFKKSLHDCVGIIPKGDLRDLLTCLTNSLRYINNSSSVSGINLIKEIMENYNLMIENNIFLDENGIMEGNLYIMYNVIAFALKEHESIEIIVKKFGNKIPEDRRENDNNYSQSLICYAKNEYYNSLEYLSRINHDFFNMKYLVKDLQMMNYYELNDYISFNYVLDSYRHFLTQNKSVTSSNKTITEDYFNSINKLFKLRESFDQFELDKLRKEVKENRPKNGFWILDKISELESVNS